MRASSSSSSVNKSLNRDVTARTSLSSAITLNSLIWSSVHFWGQSAELSQYTFWFTSTSPSTVSHFLREGPTQKQAPTPRMPCVSAPSPDAPQALQEEIFIRANSLTRSRKSSFRTSPASVQPRHSSSCLSVRRSLSIMKPGWWDEAWQ